MRAGREVPPPRGRSAGPVTEAADDARPGYPPAATAWLLGPRPTRVLDLAAGSGRLTTALVAAGHEVLVVEPSRPRAARAPSPPPGVAVLRATADALPLRRRACDAVTVAQASHGLPAVLPEIARVLRPGGVLGLVWNRRDTSVPWVARLCELLQADDRVEERAVDDLAAATEATGLFTPVEQRTFRQWQPVDRDQLLALVRSRSHVAALNPEDRQRVLDRAGRLYDDSARPATGLMLPYRTRCVRTRLRRVPRPPEAG